MTHVIVGAGEAGVQAALALRREGFRGRVVLVGGEPHVPYSRPPLSKSVLIAREPMLPQIATAEALFRRGIEFRPRTRVNAVEPSGRVVVLGEGERIEYDSLVLATGCRPRRLQVEGDGQILYLRSYDDALALRSRLTPGVRVVLIGGGYIGLELAAAARQRACDVTVLEQASSVMARVVGEDISRFFAALHARHGVTIHTSVRVESIDRHGTAFRVRCREGLDVEADLVVAGVGAEPCTELAMEAGLRIDNGIVVDEFGNTSDSRIFACGDVANHPNDKLGRRLRLESWQNAQQQAACVGATLAGKPRAYSMVPWFWSEQYDANLQVIGSPIGWDDSIVRADAEEAFTVIYLDRGVVVGGNAVNRPRDIPPIRSAIARRATPARRTLSDPTIPLQHALAA